MSHQQLGLPPVRGEDLSEAEATYGFPPVRGGRGAPSMFPRKLYQILCETDPAIISWDEDGTSWHIANYEEYIEGVMPLFYRHNKLTSFQRQLNLYGFKKRGRDEKNPGHYYHPYFQRDRPEILGGVRRSYPVTSPKWVSQGGNPAPPSAMGAAGRAATAARAAAARRAAEAAAAAAAAGVGGAAEDARRKRVARFPGREGGPFAARQEPNLPPSYRQHHMYSQPPPRARHSGYGPVFDDEAAMMMEDDPAAMMMGPAGRGGEDGAGSSLGSRKRGAPSSQGPWFYSSSNPAVAENVANARLKRSNMQHNIDAKGEMVDASNGHHGGDPWAAGAGRSSNPYGRRSGPAAGAEDSSDKQLARRDSYPYTTTNGRQWEEYREPEDAYALPPKGAGGWYDSEESGLSRLTSCDSGSSAWDEVLPHPGGPRDPRDTRRGAPRYPHHPANGPGPMMGGRSMMGVPPHRSPPTSAMFPAHLMRHERFGRYPPGGAGAYDYTLPTPPMYGMPPHAYPPETNAGGGGGSSGSGGAPSRWRPIYNGGPGPGGDDGFDGWRDGPAGPLPGEDTVFDPMATPPTATKDKDKGKAGAGAGAGAGASAESPGSGSTQPADAGREASSKADVTAEAPAAVAKPASETTADAATKTDAELAQAATGDETAGAGKTAGSERAEKGGGAYRAACEEFLTEDDDAADGDKDPEKKAAAPATSGGFHFTVPKSSGGAVGVGSGVASLPLAATAV